MSDSIFSPSDPTLDDQFRDAIFSVKEKTSPTSKDDLLILYGLYKQVSEGDCNTFQPWSVQIEQREKWDAWNKNKGMDRTVAIKKYIEKVNKLIKQ
jgi:diazepam-binding inhibitor (GABA receptor modulating acyl-CoA-binding protein)